MRKLCLLAAAVFVLSACGETVSTVAVDSDGSSKLNMAPPAFLTTRAVVRENLILNVTINRQPVDMVPEGDVWKGEAQVPVNSDVALEVRWSETFDSKTLLLAVATANVENINNDSPLDFLDTNYVSEGDAFDEDSDGISNLAERRQVTDPYDANSPGMEAGIEPMVRVPATGKDTTIDGTFEADYWNNAQFDDVNGVKLGISNIIVDEPGNMVVGDPNMQWAAIHDGEYLTLFVFGKTINPGANPPVFGSRDSGTQWFNDDSIEIYWDGDLSQATDYDTVDDMQIMIPLVRGFDDDAEANKSGETDTEIKRGANVKAAVIFDVANVEFANCLCQGFRSTWEIRINLAEAQIPIGKTFGFEIQINRDDDGTTRDSKWAWALDARSDGDTNVDSDLTWRFPSTMGTMKLLPFP